MDFERVWELTQSIASGVTYAEARVLYECAANIHGSPSGTIVEIGSYMGKSTAIFAATGPVWAIDHHRGNSEHQPGQDRCRPGTSVNGRVDTFPLFEQNMQRIGVWTNIRPLVVDHLTALDAFPAGQLPVDLLFVDAGHSYEINTSIIKHWAPRVRGLMLFHDYCADFPEMISSIDDARPLLGREVQRVEKLIGFEITDQTRSGTGLAARQVTGPVISTRP